MEIEHIIDKIDSLKPISSVGNRVMEIVYNPKSSLRDIVDVIKYDQSMTANVLRICNSSYYGFRQKISSIQQAVSLLGMEKIANMVILRNSANNFTAAQSGYDLEEGELWRYSVASALIAQDIAKKKRLSNVNHLFTSALLKDIGKVVLNTYIKDSFDLIISLVENSHYAFTEAEKEVLGIDHAELGGIIAEKWDFNPAMVDIIRNHHDPNKADAGDMSIPVVYLADSICMMIGIGVGSDGLSYRYHQEVIDRLHFTDIDLQIIIAEFWEKLRSVEELVNLSGGKN